MSASLTKSFRKRVASRGVLLLAGSLLAVGGTLLYVLLVASSNTPMFTQDVFILLGVVLVLVLALMAVAGYQLLILRRRLRAGLFGSKLTLRLIALFATIAVLPGILVYGVSVQFLNRSIESWFDVRVDKALESAVSLGRSVFDLALQDLTRKSDAMAGILERAHPARYLATINEQREQSGVQEVALFKTDSSLVAFSGGEKSGLIPLLPKAEAMRSVRLLKPHRTFESEADGSYLLRVMVPVDPPGGELLALQVLQEVPTALARDADQVKAMYRDYESLELARTGMKWLYGVSLTLALLLSLCAALLLAILFSERLAAPLRALAAGTRAVAQGDFTQRHPVRRHDELGILTESFNTMTIQLADAQAAVMRNQQALEAAKTYLESIVEKLSAGVLSLDPHYRLRSFNPSAAQILGMDLQPLQGRSIATWGTYDARLATIAETAIPYLERQGDQAWETQLEYKSEASPKVLLLRGSTLHPSVEGGFVVVFDDITRVLQAQRYAAWGEVARRLAHEFKNPLTPIQLSAERMEHRLVDKLPMEEGDMLRRSTRTIVNQVTALKSMVDAFSQYARTPETRVQPLDINLLVQEILSLYESNRAILCTLQSGMRPIMGDAARLRQVIHNLLQNAQQAVGDQADARVGLRTEATDPGARISIVDNGPGFPADLQDRLFEPYVTTKPKGTGLGLAVVKRIVEEHNGRIDLRNLPEGGAAVEIVLPWAPAEARDAESSESKVAIDHEGSPSRSSLQSWSR